MPQKTERGKRQPKNERRTRWNVALAIAGRTTGEVARTFRVSKTMLNETLAGRRVSAPLNQKIDAFIARYSSTGERGAA